MKPTLTVFTPTYNRSHTLPRTYASLCRQTSKDFEWLVIDDGSTDGTEALVKGWIAEGKIPIRYIWKENGGLHTGYNTAIANMDTELCVCIDSDDWMPDDAVEKIVSFWRKNGSNRYAGIIGLDYCEDDIPVGNPLPNVETLHIAELSSKYHNSGDRKIVMRVDLLKQVYPQPTFEGEKNFNPIYLILKIDQIHPFLLLNENLCYVDYQQDGMGANIINQYFNSPRSFMELRKLGLSLKYTTMPWRIKQYIHLIAESRIAKISPYQESISSVAVTMLYPFGLVLYYYLLSKKTI